MTRCLDRCPQNAPGGRAPILQRRKNWKGALRVGLHHLVHHRRGDLHPDGIERHGAQAPAAVRLDALPRGGCPDRPAGARPGRVRPDRRSWGGGARHRGRGDCLSVHGWFEVARTVAGSAVAIAGGPGVGVDGDNGRVDRFGWRGRVGVAARRGDPSWRGAGPDRSGAGLRRPGHRAARPRPAAFHPHRRSWAQRWHRVSLRHARIGFARPA